MLHLETVPREIFLYIKQYLNTVKTTITDNGQF